MTRILFTLFSSIGLALLSLSAHSMDLGESPIALTGDGGLDAIIAPTADGKQALVKLTGVNHPLDGVVMLTSVELRANDGRAYRAELDGKSRSLVVYERSYWAPTDYTTYLPGRDEPFAVSVDEERSGQVDLQALVAEYEQQKAQGVQAELARFDRASALQRQKTALKAIDQSASQVCGSPVHTRLDWESLSNEQLNNLSISGYCGQVASEIEYLCLQDEGFKERVKTISQVECAFSDVLDISRNNQTVVFRTPKDADNPRETISGFLQTL